jgi:glucose/mannose-6-phosphate isomerase
LITLSELKKHDKEEMFKVYDKWPELAKENYKKSYEPISFENIDHIVFAGMGGSGALGDMFQAMLSKNSVHVNVVKGYLLPKTVDSDTLVVITSISGNTAESLSVLESATKIGCKIVAFSSGGKIEKFCNKNDIEYRKISQIHSPRASFPIFLYSMLKVLGSVLGTKVYDIDDSIKQLETLGKKINSSNLTHTNPALDLSAWISGIPLIYYPWGLQAAAIRFKNSLQENAKTHVITEDVIEACHNGIVSWEKPSQVKPILIEGKDDYITTKQRWKILENYFKENKIDYKVISSTEGSILAKLIHLIYLFDYSTIYLAIKLGIDPSPIASIDYVKSKIT